MVNRKAIHSTFLPVLQQPPILSRYTNDVTGNKGPSSRRKTHRGNVYLSGEEKKLHGNDRQKGSATTDKEI